MRSESKAPLAPLTTLGLGGPATTLVEVDTAADVVEAVEQAAEPVLVLGGGSNVVVADEGFDGTVIRIRSSGVATVRRGDELDLTVEAGQNWDDLVAATVADDLAGIECLSGIPGAAGATPIQNVGAYGQEVADTIRSVTVYDRERREQRVFQPADCGFSYRHSVFKGHARHVVLKVEFSLVPSHLSRPLRFGELTRVLGVAAGDRAPLGDVRDAVLGLRRAKGMVLDAADPDTRSVGSFFTNPVLAPDEWAALLARLGPDLVPPGFEQPDGSVKTSAAWLIERAGFPRGYGRDGVSISTKHTLALTNRGDGTTAALLELAREVRAGVQEAYGVRLVNEPVLVGVAL